MKSFIILFLLFFINTTNLLGQYINVPGDFSTIQDALDAASEGDSIIVAPGTYNEELLFEDKSMFLASWFFTTGDEIYISQTILNGNSGEAVIEVNDDVAIGTSKIMGFTLHNANNGIYVNDGKADIFNCHVYGCTDALEYRDGTGGECLNNLLELNSDDGIDLNYDVDILVQDNIIRYNDGDGVEIRMEPYTGTLKSYIFRGNTIENNDNYGIQLIDYGTLSDRIFIFEENLIINNGEVGIGCISEPKGVPFEGVSIPERIYIFNNTFYGNLYGVTGGDSLVALNNIFANHSALAMKNSDAGSIISYNLLWNNTDDFENCNVDNANIIYEDPLFTSEYQLEQMSPAVDAGTSSFLWEGELVLDREPSSYNDDAPDLGAFESEGDDNPLPVKLVELDAYYYDNCVHLKWSTESEINNLGFELFRQEGDSTYILLSSYRNNTNLAGYGNSSSSHVYEYNDDEIKPGRRYSYKLVDVDYSGVKTFHKPVEINIPEDDINTFAIKLYANYPNPFNPSTTIKFDINNIASHEIETKLVIFNNLGQLIKKLFHKKLTPGTYSFRWNGTDSFGDEAEAGIYFAHLKAGQFSQTIKLHLLK